MVRQKNILLIFSILLAISFSIGLSNCSWKGKDPFWNVYLANCEACHGDKLQGTPQGPPLIGVDLNHGATNTSLIKSITQGYPTTGMPAFGQSLSETEIKRIAIMIAEERNGYDIGDFKFRTSLQLPTEAIKTEQHIFKVEPIIDGLDRWPYSIAPLPDGRILLTEKTKGLSIISPEGVQSELIRNTPKVYNDGFMMGTLQGSGWMLDVALHPDYKNNGWIYLSYSDRCSGCNEVSREQQQDVSMCALVRGRIKNGAWVDQETIWQADKESYVTTSGASIGGRICFDAQGYVFLSVGGIHWTPIPEGNIEAYLGIQDLSLPFGKIYRVYDDGRIPEDNPFVGIPNTLPGIWTYGHRSPQGLEADTTTGQLWETEMGPRGGDEVNLLKPGGNYGWPLQSNGVNYDGSEVAFGKFVGVEADLSKIEQPVVDLTPSPAVSSFVFYQGDAFPQWKGNLIVGTLKATALYRMVREGDEIVHQEVLIDHFARIRDVEVDPEGYIYLLLEHKSGSQIVRLVPQSI